MNSKDSFNWEKMKKENPCWAGCDSLEGAIKGCHNLEELFCLWKTAHIFENDPTSSFPNLSLAKCPELSPSEEFKRSFCPDGFLKEEEKLKEKSDGAPEAPVLFICRESNISGNIKDNVLNPEGVGSDGQYKGNHSIFWLQEVVRCKEKDRSDYFPDKNSPGTAEKTAQTKYFNCLSQVLEHLKVNTELSNCAYLNINKRGGVASCDQSRLAVYAQRYQLFIQREIELIDPETLVVCGELKDPDLRHTLEEIFRSCKKQEYWVYPKHPSRYTKDDVPKEVKLSKKE